MSRGIFDEFNRGRLRKEKHRAARRAFRAAPAPVTPGRPTPQAVVKVVSWGKSSRSALKVATYITRSRPKDRDGQAIPAINRHGNEIAPEDLAEYLKGWNLIPDEKNLSGAALAAEPGDRWKMPEKDRLNKRQVGHMILSVPPTAGATSDQMHRIARDTLNDVFGEAGVDYLYVVHDDHSRRPHIHVVFEAAITKSRQLRIGPEDLRIIREAFAERAQEHGIQLAATAREDRAELAQGIAEGRVRARERHRYIDGRKQERAEPEMPWLARQAPLYHARHGAEYQRRIAGKHGAAIDGQPQGQARHAVPVAPLPLPPMPAKQARHIEKASQSFVEPTKAYAAFAELYAENPKAALWAMNNRPDVFGTVDEARPAPKLYLREKEQAARPIDTPAIQAAKAQAIDALMQKEHGANWRKSKDEQIRGSDAARLLPIVQAEARITAQVNNDPKFTVTDPNEKSLKAWRDQAKVALSAPVQEPRPVAAARAASTQAATVEMNSARQARTARNNLRIAGRASARYDAPGARPAPQQAPRMSPAPKAPEAPQTPAAGTPAAGKALPNWMQRMFRRGEGKAEAPRGSASQIDATPKEKPAPASQPTPVTSRTPVEQPKQQPKPTPVPPPRPAPQSPQVAPKRAPRRDRSRDDDRER